MRPHRLNINLFEQTWLPALMIFRWTGECCVELNCLSGVCMCMCAPCWIKIKWKQDWATGGKKTFFHENQNTEKSNMLLMSCWKTWVHAQTQGHKIPPDWYCFAAFTFVFTNKKREREIKNNNIFTQRPTIEVAVLIICFISISGWREMQISYTRRRRGQH